MNVCRLLVFSASNVNRLGQSVLRGTSMSR